MIASGEIHTMLHHFPLVRYENPGVFTPLQLAQIRKSTLAGVICRNGDDIDRIQVADWE